MTNPLRILVLQRIVINKKYFKINRIQQTNLLILHVAHFNFSVNRIHPWRNHFKSQNNKFSKFQMKRFQRWSIDWTSWWRDSQRLNPIQSGKMSISKKSKFLPIRAVLLNYQFAGQSQLKFKKKELTFNFNHHKRKTKCVMQIRTLKERY